MKITFIMPADDLSGGNRVVATYAKALHARGHDVLVINKAPPRPTLWDCVRALRHGRWALFKKPATTPMGHVAHSGVKQCILEQPGPMRPEDLPDADILIATWWETSVWMQSMPPSKGAKVHLIQDYEVWWTEEDVSERVHAALRGNNCKIAISNELKRTLNEKVGDLDVVVIPNAVDLQQFDAPQRGRNPLPTVGFMYSNSQRKAADIYYQACQLALRDLPTLQVISFGGDLPSPELPLPADTSYVHRPAQNQIASIYASCDVWLFGSRIDSFGLPILESMACRTPVIGVPVGAATELLTDGVGVLVAPESPSDMAQAMVAFFRQSPAQWQTMSQLAYDRAHSYTWDDATDRLVQVLTACVAQQSAGPLQE